MKRVLIYIPVKNEEKTVKTVVDEVAELYPDWDIIVVDDSSDDNTIKETQKTKARLIPLLINTKGVGPDLTAFLIAKNEKYDFLVKIDGDGQQEPKLLKSLIQTLAKNNADIAVGSRYLRKQEETDSFIKIVGRVTTSALINFKVRNKNKITDCTSGIRAWNSKSISILINIYMKNHLAHDTVFWIREAILASRLGLKFSEVPAFYHPRQFDKSKSFSLKNMIIFPFRFLLILFV